MPFCSLSRVHEKYPYELELGGETHKVDYVAGESTTHLFGGNSNWRGPIWLCGEQYSGNSVKHACSRHEVLDYWLDLLRSLLSGLLSSPKNLGERARAHFSQSAAQSSSQAGWLPLGIKFRKNLVRWLIRLLNMWLNTVHFVLFPSELPYRGLPQALWRLLWGHFQSWMPFRFRSRDAAWRRGARTFPPFGVAISAGQHRREALPWTGEEIYHRRALASTGAVLRVLWRRLGAGMWGKVSVSQRPQRTGAEGGQKTLV